jgi:rod shape-determining protein MreD
VTSAVNSPTAVVPTLSILPFAIITAMPWNAPDWVSFALPLVTLTAVHFWSEQRPGLVPAPIILCIGVLVDLITDGPLGYWAALFLLAYALGVQTHVSGSGAAQPKDDGTILPTLRRTCVMLAIVAVCAWLIACLYYVRLFNPLPIAAGGLLALALQPVVVFLLHPLVALVAGRPTLAAYQAGGR